MSRRNNGPSKVEHDARETPQALADAIVERVDGYVTLVPRILEPSSGSGVFVRACRANWPDSLIHSVDIRPETMEQVVTGVYPSEHFVDNTVEFAADQLADGVRYDLIIGNPPFTFAEQHIRALLPLLSDNALLAFILRLNFLGSGGRARGFWKELPETTSWTIAPRPSFGLNKYGKKGTDGTEYAVFVWEKRNGKLVDGVPTRGAHIIGPDEGWSSPKGLIRAA